MKACIYDLQRLHKIFSNDHFRTWSVLSPDSQLLLGNFPPPFLLPSPDLHAEHDAIWYGTNFWLWGQLKIGHHQVMILQPMITNNNHGTSCISRCILHISTTTFSFKWVYLTIWSIMTLGTSSKSTPPAELYWYFFLYYFILLTLVPR